MKHTRAEHTEQTEHVFWAYGHTCVFVSLLSLPLSLFPSLSFSLCLPTHLSISLSLFRPLSLSLSLSPPLSLSLPLSLSPFLSLSLSLSLSCVSIYQSSLPTRSQSCDFFCQVEECG